MTAFSGAGRGPVPDIPPTVRPECGPNFTGGYFKTGVYTQANCADSAPCDSGNYGQVTVYKITVTHS